MNALRSFGRIAAGLFVILGFLLAIQSPDYFVLVLIAAGIAAFVSLRRGHIALKVLAGGLCVAVMVESLMRAPKAPVPHLYNAFAITALVCLVVVAVVPPLPPRTKSREEEIADLVYRAGKLDHKGDWDEAIAVYEKIQTMGDDQQSQVAASQIELINAKKSRAGM